MTPVFKVGEVPWVLLASPDLEARRVETATAVTPVPQVPKAQMVCLVIQG